MSMGDKIRDVLVLEDDPVPFEPDNINKGKYVVGGTGTIVLVKKWTVIQPEGEEPRDSAGCYIWKPGDDEDVQEFLERTLPDEDGYYHADKETLLSAKAFKPTDGKGWPFTEDQIRTFVYASDDDNGDDDTSQLLQDEIVKKAKEREDGTGDEDDDDEVVEEGDIEELPDEFIDDDSDEDEQNDEEETHITDTDGLRTDEWDSSSFDANFYNYVRRNGPQDMRELEKIAIEQDMFGKQAEEEGDVRPRVIEAIDAAREEGFSLRLVHEGGPDEAVVVGEEAKFADIQVEGAYHDVVAPLKLTATQIFNNSIFDDVSLKRVTVTIETSDGVTIEATETGAVNK